MRPNLHFTPIRNWMNDPVGLIYYKGKYHLFYQYFPYGKRWGTMHWAHAISGDLLHWQHLPVALYPSKYEDCNGCFSGSAAEEKGEMQLYYTGVRYDEPIREDIHCPKDDQYTSCQLKICSKDGITFDNQKGKKVIIPPFEDIKMGSRIHTRDPKVWKDAFGWHIILGSQCEYEGRLVGQLLFYGSDDGEDWEYQGKYQMPGEKMIECPDLFEVDGHWVFMASFMDKGRGEQPENLAYGGIVTFYPQTGRIEMDPDSLKPLDMGMDIYAAQTFKDARGRNIMFAWIRMPKSFDGEPWIGMCTMPRVIRVGQEGLRFAVHPSIKSQFTEECKFFEFMDGAVLIEADLEDGGNIYLGGFCIRRSGETLYTDRSCVFPADEVHWARKVKICLHKGQCHLEIYLDNGVVEVFVNGGENVITQVLYGMDEDFSCEHVLGLRCRKMVKPENI